MIQEKSWGGRDLPKQKRIDAGPALHSLEMLPIKWTLRTERKRARLWRIWGESCEAQASSKGVIEAHDEKGSV